MRNIFKLLALLFFWLGTQNAVMAKAVVVTSEGTGSTFEEARTSALQDAIMQVTGVTLDARTVQQLTHQTQSSVDNGSQHQQTFTESSLSKEVREKLRGYVNSYQLLDRQQLADGRLQVRLKVSIEKWELNVPANDRRTLTVQAFDASTGVCFNNKLDAEAISTAAVDAIHSALTSTRKFAVLDRDGEAYAAEREFLTKNPDVRPQELARIGNLKGSDYILSGKVRNLIIGQTKNKSSLNNTVFVDRYARADILFNVMLFADGQVQLSAPVKVNIRSGLAGKTCGEILTALMENGAKQIAEQTVATIFPPRVIEVNGQDILVNYGSPNFKVGQTYNIYAAGKIIYDPYTKEQLGRSEELIGQVTAVDVKPKFSILRMKQAQLTTKVQPGAIVRPLQKSTSTTKAKAKRRKVVSDDEW